MSGAAAAATIGKALGVWGDILQAHTTAWNAVQGFVGITAGYLSTLGDVQSLFGEPPGAASGDQIGCIARRRRS